jgi:hypothetical protein
MFGSNHGIVCWNEAISDTLVALGMGEERHGGSFFCPMKNAFSIFEVQKSSFFIRQLP